MFGRWIFIPVSTLILSLAGCLRTTLPLMPSQPPANAEPRETIYRNPVVGPVDRESYLDQLSGSLTQNSGTDTHFEELVRLLREMNENPIEYSLSLSDIRSLQNFVFDSQVELPSAAAVAEPEFDLSKPLECPAPHYEVHTLASGFRLIPQLPRRDPCGLVLSRIYQDLLNHLLVGEATEFRYGAETLRATSLEDFFALLHDRGFAVDVTYRTYLAPFVRLYAKEGDPYDAETEIALPLWLRPPIRHVDGTDFVVPAAHSEIFFRVRAPDGGAEAQFKIYFSDRGFAFDDEDLAMPHWSGMRTLDTIQSTEVPRLLQILPQLRTTFDIFKSRAPRGLPLGGFGLLGVCNDGAALAMRAMRGLDYPVPFPLVRTDRIRMPDTDYPLRALWEQSPSDTWMKGMDASERPKMVERLLLGNPFVDLPNPFPKFSENLQRLAAEAGP